MRGKPRNITIVVGSVQRVEYVASRKVVRLGVTSNENDRWHEYRLRGFFDALGITKRDCAEAFGDFPYVSKEEDTDIAETMK